MKSPLHPLDNQRGVTLMVVLLMMVVMGFAAAAAGRAWKSVMQQVREEELLFRGDQYRRAIESYYKAAQAGGQGAYPKSIEELLKDPRALQTVRHLREEYKDPMTGKDFELVKEGGTITGLAGATQSLGGIKGVRSTSSLEPFKKGGFREPYEKFDKAEKYSSWEFVYEAGQARTPAAGQAGQPGQPPLPGTAQPGQPAGGPSDSPFPPTSGTIDTQNPFK